MFNPDNNLNGTPQNSHGSFIANKLHKLLNRVTEPARGFMVSAGDFQEFAQITCETSVDHMSTALEVLRENSSVSYRDYQLLLPLQYTYL